MGADEQKTVTFDDMPWLPPVESLADLPDEAPRGALCFVQAESAVYSFTDGEWIAEARREDDESDAS